MTRRQPALLPEVALESWATPLQPLARTSLRRFKRQAQEVSASELLATINAHLGRVEEAQRSNEARERNLLFAGATRARETLWVSGRVRRT